MNQNVRKAISEDANNISKFVHDYYKNIDNKERLLDYFKPNNLKDRLSNGIENIYITTDGDAVDEITGLITFTCSDIYVHMGQILIKKDLNQGEVISKLAFKAFDEIKPKEGFRKLVASTEHTNYQSMIMLLKMGFLPEAKIRHGFSKNVHQIVWTMYIDENGYVEDPIML